MSALSGPRSDDGGETGTGARRDETERCRATDGADTTGGELRVDVAVAVRARMEFDGYTWDGDNAYAEDMTYGIADSVLALPALRDLIAERDTLAAQVQAVEGLLPRIEGVIEFDMAGERYDAVMSVQQVLEHLRRALGTPTTGGGE